MKATTQIVQSVGAVIGSSWGGWVAGRMEARWSYFTMSFGSWILSVIVFTSTVPGEWSFYMGSFLLGVVGVSFFGWLPYYLPGLFPTRIRKPIGPSQGDRRTVTSPVWLRGTDSTGFPDRGGALGAVARVAFRHRARRRPPRKPNAAAAESAIVPDWGPDW